MNAVHSYVSGSISLERGSDRSDSTQALCFTHHVPAQRVALAAPVREILGGAVF